MYVPTHTQSIPTANQIMEYWQLLIHTFRLVSKLLFEFQQKISLCPKFFVYVRNRCRIDRNWPPWGGAFLLVFWHDIYQSGNTQKEYISHLSLSIKRLLSLENSGWSMGNVTVFKIRGSRLFTFTINEYVRRTLSGIMIINRYDPSLIRPEENHAWVRRSKRLNTNQLSRLNYLVVDSSDNVR